MIRLGLCCKFHREPIRFFTATERGLSRLTGTERMEKIGRLCRQNARSLFEAIRYCADHGIGAFRVNSQILPLRTHPRMGYEVIELPEGHHIIDLFRECGREARSHDIRLTFHPDQFILLSSTDPGITLRSIEELAYQAEVSDWIGADVINLHGGGAYGDKGAALERVFGRIRKLDRSIRQRLTLENDDRVYTPADLLPWCEDSGVPFVYDVHHHRCLPDGQSVEQVTRRALKTWNREPLFHVSSPREGWNGPRPNLHHDYIDPADFPHCWRHLDITVEVEAKAKELAILKLREELWKKKR